MKHKIVYSFLAGAALMFSSTACSPDDESLPVADLSQEDIVEGKAFSVVVDQTTNKVTMKSLLPASYTVQWIHPQGVEKKSATEANIPFAGNYEIRFGVMTRGGMVYGEPYTITLDNTNGDLLTDPLWDYLTGGSGQSKTWVLDHNQYDLGGVTFCCPYMGWDKFTDGKTFTESDAPNYKDLGLDSPDWTWQAGEPDWMFPADQWASMPELTFDLVNGANLTVNGETKAFVMDPDRKTLTMPAGVNWLCESGMGNFLTDYVNAEIVKLNEHVLGIKVIRNDGKGGQGDQRLVFCYVEKGWDGKWPSNGPSAEIAPVKQPSYDNLAESLFTIVGPDATYYATNTTLLLDEETPYDYIWWNGAGEGSWQWLDNYGTPSAPAYGSADSFALNLSRKNGEYKADLETIDGEASSAFSIVENKIVFDKEITLLSVENGPVIKGKEFTVMACRPEDEFVAIGIPAAKDENGAVNRYLCARLKIKPVGAAQSGPTVIKVDNQYCNNYVESNDHYRVEVYNAFYDADGLYSVDVTKLRLRKGQTIKVRFTLSGITWKAGADPKVLFAHNFEVDGINTFSWPSNGNGFDIPEAVSLNKGGETEITFTNTSASTITFEGKSCLTLCIQQAGLVDSPLDANGVIDAAEVTATVTSITIE